MLFITTALTALSTITTTVVNAYAFDYPYGTSDVSIVKTDDVRFIVGPSPTGPTYDAHVNVLLAVKNKAYNKVVGVRYTNDAWTTSHEATGIYVNNLDASYELWNVSISRGAYPDNLLKFKEVELADYVSYKNHDTDTDREWDPNNNYYAVLKATPDHPLAVTTQFTLFYGDGGPFAGYMRTWSKTSSPNDTITVRWTGDNWATFTDTVLKNDNKNGLWDWYVQNAYGQSIQSAARYDRYIHQRTFWANNNGANFLVTPEVTPA